MSDKFEDFSDSIEEEVDYEDYEEELEDDKESLNLDDERSSNFLKLTSDAFTRKFEKIKVKEIGFTDPIKKGRQNTMTGLSGIIKDLGVLTPIHVMTVEDPDDDYKYVLLKGLRRVYGAMKNGQEEIDAIVWDFHDKDQGADLALYLSLLLGRTQKRSWGEIWHLYQILEMQSSVITPGTLEYLLQLNSGDAMKLKDIMLCDYDDVKQALLSDEKDLEACYKMLAKLRKEEDRLAIEDETGVDTNIEGTEDLVKEKEIEGQLSEQDVLELLDMAEDLDDLDATEEDFSELNSGDSEYVDQQKVGERHPLDPALKSAVLNRDKFKCKCCGFGGAAALGVLAVHHVLPVHVGGKDTLDNLVTLCLNHHILLHVAERNGGRLQMTKEEFDSYNEEEQEALKRCLKLAKVAVEANKRKGLSKEQVLEATKDSVRHPMPGAGLSDNRRAYDESKYMQTTEIKEEN